MNALAYGSAVVGVSFILSAVLFLLARAIGYALADYLEDR